MVVVVGLSCEEKTRGRGNPEWVIEVDLGVEVAQGQDCVEMGHKDVDADEVGGEVELGVIHEGSITREDIAVDGEESGYQIGVVPVW